MRVWGYFRSGAAFRLRIALALKGLAPEPVYLHLRRNEHLTDTFAQLNPQQLIPALATDDGQLLTQSMAIIEYLDETHPQPPLLPATPLERARVRSIAQSIACDIHPLNNLRVLRYLAGPMGQDEAARAAWTATWIGRGLAALETRLATEAQTGRFCHGDSPSLADICLIPQLLSAERFDLSLEPYPTLLRIRDACTALPAFAEAHPDRQPDWEPG